MQENNNELRAKLAQKINAMAHAIGQVKAEGKNNHSNYDFVGYEQINAIIRSMCPQFGLNIMPSVIDATETTFPDNKGRQIVRTQVKMSFLLTDTETGYCEERFGMGADQDTQGKSFGQAVTEAQKRFELKLFHISTKADVDPDSKSTEVYQKQPQATMQSGAPSYNEVQGKFSDACLKLLGLDPVKVFEVMRQVPHLNVTPQQTIDTLTPQQEKYVESNIVFFQQQGC